jgi:hypothetical protein
MYVSLFENMMMGNPQVVYTRFRSRNKRTSTIIIQYRREMKQLDERSTFAPSCPLTLDPIRATYRRRRSFRSFRRIKSQNSNPGQTQIQSLRPSVSGSDSGYNRRAIERSASQGTLLSLARPIQTQRQPAPQGNTEQKNKYRCC